MEEIVTFNNMAKPRRVKISFKKILVFYWFLLVASLIFVLWMSWVLYSIDNGNLQLLESGTKATAVVDRVRVAASTMNHKSVNDAKIYFDYQNTRYSSQNTFQVLNPDTKVGDEVTIYFSKTNPHKFKTEYYLKNPDFRHFTLRSFIGIALSSVFPLLISLVVLIYPEIKILKTGAMGKGKVVDIEEYIKLKRITVKYKQGKKTIIVPVHFKVTIGDRLLFLYDPNHPRKATLYSPQRSIFEVT